MTVMSSIVSSMNATACGGGLWLSIGMVAVHCRMMMMMMVVILVIATMNISMSVSTGRHVVGTGTVLGYRSI